jgi:hypothetical protein
LLPLNSKRVEGAEKNVKSAPIYLNSPERTKLRAIEANVRYRSPAGTEHVSECRGGENVGIVTVPFKLLTTGRYPHEPGASAHDFFLPHQPGIAGRRTCFSVKAPLTIGTRSVNRANLDGGTGLKRLRYRPTPSMNVVRARMATPSLATSRARITNRSFRRSGVLVPTSPTSTALFANPSKPAPTFIVGRLTPEQRPVKALRHRLIFLPVLAALPHFAWTPTKTAGFRQRGCRERGDIILNDAGCWRIQWLSTSNAGERPNRVKIGRGSVTRPHWKRHGIAALGGDFRSAPRSVHGML